ncbi:hypothetical protein QBC38DRAFT_97122 [Podospora fimiseda]|uniref:Uncharacterized protein n=1 Tax=Podospora fimiseda TaxID=252190 RepID=A0AAN7BV79_9PEZI|nr:hypothetical protein QBC38DRAFT_97122 [Podospora fimiseda]
MAIFVDLEEDGVVLDSPQNGQVRRNDGIDVVKPFAAALISDVQKGEEAHEPEVRENPNRNSMTQAFGCYPIIHAIASNIDLNTLDSLSQTCHQIRQNLLQNRDALVKSTLHCCNENLPVDPGESLRYRARAGNWFYMEEAGRAQITGKSGQCARDLVSECRRCGTVVCRNCAIKPPAPIVLRDRHRRLCTSCVKAPLGNVVKPRLGPEVRIDSDQMERAICECGSRGVWLCQPCGRSIRSDDQEYQSIWRWRNQYTDVLGGLGTGIGEGDRGVICGRDRACCAAREKEHETDCDAQDAREAEQLLSSNSSNPSSASSSPLPWADASSSASSLAASAAPGLQRRTPSPILKPGYERHEIEGIGGVVKKKLVRMVKVGACVPEWDDERARGEIMGREVKGERRSWCGWCWRVIPSKQDYEHDRQGGAADKGKGKQL